MILSLTFIQPPTHPLWSVFGSGEFLTGLIGVVTGLVTGGFALWQLSRKFTQQIEKYELERRHSQDDAYLDRARAHVETVYVPLSAALSRLKAVYNQYLFGGKRGEDKSYFIAEIDNFVGELERLERRGDTAYLTTALEERVQSFAAFLRASKDAATEADKKKKVDFNFALNLGNLSVGRRGKTDQAKLAEVFGQTSVNVSGLSLSMGSVELTRAPVSDPDFQARFERDVNFISVLVKEVTLGVPARRPDGAAQ
ncbi:hypothetical protein [Antarctobacter sp.]|uniref:hypothetical protein n=1 Tax=Antarctobacter sp. TaxID=1872577 RepID=UPI002B26FBA3|nr:hypothetical protein [Antarctobacter sp.]